MKRRGVGVAVGSGPKKSKWREEADSDDARSMRSDQSLGEQLPSEDEEPAVAATCEEEERPTALPPESSTLEPNPVAWLQLRVGDKHCLPMYFELFQDVSRAGVQNFCALCRGDFTSAGRKLGFAGMPFLRVFPGSIAQVDSVDVGDLCGEALTILSADDVSGTRTLAHSRAGLLSATAHGHDADGCQFFISLGSSSQRHKSNRIVFGQLLGADAAGQPFNEKEMLLWPLRYLDAVGSASGFIREKDVVVESCGVCSAAERSVFDAFLIPSRCSESDLERYGRARFSYPPLVDIVSGANAQEVLNLTSSDIDSFEQEVEALAANTTLESGMAKTILHRCEVFEVGLTRVLLLLDEVDFHTLGEVRAAGKRAHLRVRKLSAKLAQIKAGSADGETEAYEQRPGL